LNNKVKYALKSAFEAPKPKKKDSFLKDFNYPKTTNQDFLISQISYIRKRVWMFSFLLMAAVILAATGVLKGQGNSSGAMLIWIFSAILPFLALLTVTELTRSACCCMVELEMSCRYNLAKIVITRASVLGAVNFLLLIFLLAVASRKSDFGVLRAGLYLFVPYMLTCMGSLLIMNKLDGREGVYGCGAVAVSVSLTEGILSMTKQLIFSESFTLFWTVLFAVCVWSITVQIRQYIRKTEEFLWNSLLID